MLLETDRLKFEREMFEHCEERKAERFSLQQERLRSQREMQLRMISVLDKMIQKLK
jgi:hypothetical protein